MRNQNERRAKVVIGESLLLTRQQRLVIFIFKDNEAKNSQLFGWNPVFDSGM